MSVAGAGASLESGCHSRARILAPVLVGMAIGIDGQAHVARCHACGICSQGSRSKMGFMMCPVRLAGEPRIASPQAEGDGSGQPFHIEDRW